MSKMFTIQVGNNDSLTFFCSSRDTRNGFAHDCTVFLNGVEITNGHAYYLNRTWERWTYETVCIEALNNGIKQEEKAIAADYKIRNNINRITAKHKQTIDEIKTATDGSPCTSAPLTK